jgi:hypothetical protein
MKLIDLEQTTKTHAEIIAENILIGLNEELQKRIATHRRNFLSFWASAATPDDILLAMEMNAVIFLQAASENVQHIGRLAAIVGKEITDFLPIEYWQPKRAFVVSELGVVTLEAPAEGFDAWGNMIPVVEE